MKKTAKRNKGLKQRQVTIKVAPPPPPLDSRTEDCNEIWLEPSCNRCVVQERTWCQHPVYVPCVNCGKKPAHFVSLAAVTELLHAGGVPPGR
jgi:hypothetical protein